MTPEKLQSYHEYTRTKGVNPVLYVVARAVLTPFFLIYFRLSRIGRDHVPHEGPLLVASNHRSFLDPFVIAVTLPWRRPMHYMAKEELFARRGIGWILSRLGAFPVRRGEADHDTMDTARAILQRGGAVCVFPEGTRIRSGSLGRPRRGTGRLALETGAKVLPVAVHGSDRCRRGWRILPRKVKVRAGQSLRFPQVDDPTLRLATEISNRVWPNIELQWEWLGGLPPMKTAAVIGAGSWGTAVAVLLARGGLDVQLGCRRPEQVEAIRATGVNEQYLPDFELPDTIEVKRAGDIELAAMDLVCLAVPSKGLPAAVGSVADRVGDRSALLLLSKGFVAPQGDLPSEYAEARIRCRAIACLGGPALALEAAEGTAALVLASTDADLREQLARVFDEAGVVCERTSDITGVEIAGAAKNAAALAAAALEPAGLNAAGAAAAAVWRECTAYGALKGADPDTFSGTAGVGDLTATVLAPTSRNRRAGTLLGQGVPAERIPEIIGQASESLDSVPLMLQAFDRAGIDAPALASLTGLIRGEYEPATVARQVAPIGVSQGPGDGR